MGWRPQKEESLSKSGLAIFRNEVRREQIALVESFTSGFFQQGQQRSSCFGAGTWTFSKGRKLTLGLEAHFFFFL